jgi:hypothetical protein
MAKISTEKMVMKAISIFFSFDIVLIGAIVFTRLV